MDVVEKVNRAAHFLIRNLWKAAVHWMCQRGNLVCGPLHYTVAVDSSHIVHLDSGRRTVLNLVPTLIFCLESTKQDRNMYIL